MWKAHGRLPQRGQEASGSVYNQQLNVQSSLAPEDMKAAMSLLKQERRRLEAEQPIELDPSAIERSGGERNGP